MLKGRTAVVLDQHPLWHEAVEPVLCRLGIDVIGKTTSPEDALALVEEHTSDLLIAELDLGRGELEGISFLRLARERAPELRLIVLSLHEEPELIRAAFGAGASAYVLKSVHPDDLASAIRQTFRTSIFLAGGSSPVAADGPPRAPMLTEREREILRLVGEGHSNRELAKMLWVTEQTIKFHLSNIYRKLVVSNRTEASRWAQANGVLPPTVRHLRVAETPATKQ